jgi:hypothetical protein
MGWQKIETAPKDGTWIMIYGSILDEGDDRHMAVAQWTTYLNGDEVDGHWQFAWYDGGYYGSVDDATYWMPLPEPPK